MKTFLSGIQSSGRLHLGNYFGAIRQQVDSQNQPGEYFYFIADYHALTTCRDPDELRDNVLEVALSYLALGLDPDKVVLFRQSDVPEVCELTWLLSCVTPMGLLERAHSYKDKLAKGLQANVGLFTYPVLMASDILAYDSHVVPVGKDQKQHVEMARDIAGTFNHLFGEDCLVIPEPQIPSNELVARVPGIDGEKMSKSYGNSIWIFEEGKKLKKAIGQIKTDSREPAEPKDPDELLLMTFLELFLDGTELEQWRQRIREGGEGAPGYGHMKVRMVEAMDELFATARARRAELLADKGEVERILTRGSEKARERARATVDRCYRACGIR